MNLPRMVNLRRIHPEPGELTPAEAAAAITVPEGGRERPYLMLNFVSTADGSVTIGGRSGPIGDEADRALFHALRARADAVMVGAGTVRTERYGRMIRDPDVRAEREKAGRAPEPLACIVSASLELPPDLPLLCEPGSRVAILTPSDARIEDAAASVEYVRGDEMTASLRELRARHGVEVVLCEGGPRLAASLLREGLVDELLLSLAPKLAGGESRLGIVTGELEAVVGMELVWALEAAGTLFLRYRIAA